MSVRGKGYCPDSIPANRKTPFSHLSMRLDAAALADSVSLLDMLPLAFDQGASGSCTGNATAAAITARLRRLGHVSLQWVASQINGYTLGRAIDRSSPRIALTDDGAEPNQVVRGLEEFGTRAMGPSAPDGRYSDVDFLHVNDEPSLVDLEADALDVFMGAYAITASGADRRQQIAQAIANGIAVCVAVDASDEAGPIQIFTGGVIEDMAPGGVVQLDHYVCVVGYENGSGPDMVLTVRNSWGKDYGVDGGNFRLAGKAIDQLGDLWALDTRLVGGAP